MQADIACSSRTWWSNGSGARLTLCGWQRQAGQKVFHSHDAQSLDGDGCDSQMLLFVRELNASTACSLSSHSRDRFHRSSHSHPHSPPSCSCMACVQPAPLLCRARSCFRDTSSCSGKTLPSTQLQHRTTQRAAAPFPPTALPRAATGP